MDKAKQFRADFECKVYSIEQLQVALDLGRDSAYKLCKQKGFPAIKLGGSWKVPRVALDKWLEGEFKRLV